MMWTQFYSKRASEKRGVRSDAAPTSDWPGLFIGVGADPAATRRPNFVLAARPPLPHNAIMVETHPFTFRIEPDPLRELRYRWTVCEGTQVHVRSPHSYATRREAENEAAKAVARREDHWRNGG